MTIKAIDPARVRELFTYDPSTGVLRWAKPQSNRVKVGDVAGCIKSSGAGHQYWVVKFDDVQYRRARVVWAFVHGVDPGAEVDHRDRDTLNDRISNLREATRTQNALNRVSPKSVYPHLPQRVRPKRRRGKHVGYIARATIDGRRRDFGPYASPEEASQAVEAAIAHAHGAEWLPS